jgi:outer membrane murein-binding lipoprotein Lpp
MQPWEIVLTVGAVTGAFLVIAGAVYRIYKIAKRIDDALGLDRQGRTIADRLSRIEHQLFPNGGSSLTDKINQIAFEQQTLKGEVDSLKEVVTILIGEKR